MKPTVTAIQFAQIMDNASVQMSVTVILDIRDYNVVNSIVRVTAQAMDSVLMHMIVNAILGIVELLAMKPIVMGTLFVLVMDSAMERISVSVNLDIPVTSVKISTVMEIHNVQDMVSV